MSGGFKNITVYGDSPTIKLQPSTSWMRNADSNSWYTFDLGANLTATIPANATAAYWNSEPISGAGEYSLCLDCLEPDILNNNLSAVQWIDGSTSKTSETIWSMTSIPSSSGDHVLRIRNQDDQRFNGSGTLSIVSLVITIPQNIKNSESSPTINVPVSSQASTGPLKAAIAVAVIEAAVILFLVGFIVLRLRKKKRYTEPTPPVQQREFHPTTPLIVHTRASSANAQEYDPYEEMENPSDMPPPRSRLRVQSNVSRASSALSANSIFRSLAGMFPTTPNAEDRSASVSRSASIQSRGTHLASYFDFENSPQGRLTQSSPSPPTSRIQSPRPTTPTQSLPGSGANASTRSSKESEGTSKNAVENGGDDPRSHIDARRLRSYKAEFVQPPENP